MDRVSPSALTRLPMLNFAHGDVIMVGAFVLDIWDAKDSLSSDHFGTIAVGFVASFVFGLIVIKVMLDFVQKRGFAPFGWWRILVGGAGLAAI